MHATVGEAAIPSSPTRGDEISVGDLLRIIWRERWLILIVTAVCAGGAGGLTFLMHNKYEAQTLLLPVTQQSSSGGGLGNITSGLSQIPGVGALAALTGMGGGGSRAESIATLQAETLTERYLQENDLLPILFYRKWDSTAKRWKVTDPDDVPTLWKGSRFFKEHIRTLTEDAKTGLVSLTITWNDPKLAAQWANGLVQLTNTYLRDKAIQESDRHIAYLRSQVEGTNDVELRNVIYSLIESEIKRSMMARGDQEYALKVVDAAVVPEKPSSPKRPLWFLGGGIVGFALALSAGLIRARPA